MFTELIQEMDTLAAPENTDLLSRGGSAPVELVDSSTEDEELGQERKEVEVVVVNSTEPSITVPGEDTTCKEASSLWPAGQVRPNNMYDKVQGEGQATAHCEVQQEGLGQEEEGEVSEGEEDKWQGLCDPKAWQHIS